MSLDQVIEHLQAMKQKHGGNITVMIGQTHPDNAKLWSGIDVTPEMIRESVFQTSVTSVPGYASATGWIWFQVPDGGIKHHPRVRPSMD